MTKPCSTNFPQNGSAPTVFALDAAGNRTGEVPCEWVPFQHFNFSTFQPARADGTLRFSVSTVGPIGEGRIYYEIVRAKEREFRVELSIDGNPSLCHSSFVTRPSPEAAPAASVRCRLTDGDRTDESVPMPSEMPPHSFLVATLPWQ